MPKALPAGLICALLLLSCNQKPDPTPPTAAAPTTGPNLMRVPKQLGGPYIPPPPTPPWPVTAGEIPLDLKAPETKPLPIRMLVPGFTIRELPVDLTNLNNLEYHADGRLFAVGYDGRVHVLTDTDGDGLEDTAKAFYAPKATDLRAPVGMAIAPEGIYIASKGRISLLKDSNNDNVADSCEMVVGGWPELFVAVDSLGVAIDHKKNAIIYGRGCANFTDPLLIDKKTGKAGYSLSQETGTIMKVSPDRKSREIVATGIRFSVGLQFNRYGDLFATDQEGATWAPGENVLDELNHIQKGRHYGFPARNAKHLPDVIDEPAVVEFGPQHQSTCGFRFNERVATAVKAVAPWGPSFWENDAIVTGESRGKIWRCPLVKTEAGYVGKPILVASLDMLTIDLAISPKGDLVVCCHSGPPDWGTGPKGKGRIFKISYTDPAAPQPVIAYPVSLNEVRVAFDKPLDPYVLTTRKVLLTGQYVRAADRMESMRPPYKVLEEHARAPIQEVKVVGQSLADGGRTLVLKTEKLPWFAAYALAIPGVKAVGAAGQGQIVDLDFTLNGVLAKYKADGLEIVTTLPHFDLSVAEAWTRGSVGHDLLRQAQDRRGELALSTVLKLPGAETTLRMSSTNGLGMMPGVTMILGPHDEPKDRREMIASFDNNGKLAPLTIKIPTAVGHPANFSISYHTDADPTERPLRVEQMILPFAAELPRPPAPPAEPPLLKGDWHRGKALFFGEAKCATCHTFSSDQTTLGPNLGNLHHKDPASVMRDILTPNASVNPDYLSYKVKLKDGQLLAGLTSSDGPDHLKIMEGPEKVTRVARSQVVSLTPDTVSIMPEGFKDLGPEKLDDIVKFLTTVEPKKEK